MHSWMWYSAEHPSVLHKRRTRSHLPRWCHASSNQHSLGNMLIILLHKTFSSEPVAQICEMHWIILECLGFSDVPNICDDTAAWNVTNSHISSSYKSKTQSSTCSSEAVGCSCMKERYIISQKEWILAVSNWQLLKAAVNAEGCFLNRLHSLSQPTFSLPSKWSRDSVNCKQDEMN